VDFEVIELPQPLFGLTNVIRLGHTMIDSGHVSDMCTAALLEHMDQGQLQGIEQVILTHPHIDHAGGSMAMKRIAELPHIMYEGAPEIVQDEVGYIHRVQEEQGRLLQHEDPAAAEAVFGTSAMYFPLDQPYEKVNVGRVVLSGDRIDVGGATLEAIHTPGHEAHHIVLYHEPSGTLFAGDAITANAQFSRGPLTSRVAEYEASLKMLLALSPKRIVPAHGGVIENPNEHLKRCIANVGRTKKKILGFLEKCDQPGRTPTAIAEAVFKERDPLRKGILVLIILSYLQCMEAEGMVVVNWDDHGASLS